MRKLSSLLTAPFAPSAQEGGISSLGLHIEPDTGFFSDTDIHLRLLPGVDAVVRASDGNIRKGAVHPLNVNPGVISFSGSDTASLPYPPVYSSPMFQVLFAFDLNGNETPIGIVYDSQSKEVRANKPCYAAVRFSAYQSNYLELIYSPLVEVISGGGSAVTIGAIAAFYPPNNITVYEPELRNPNEGNAEQELYRVVSTAVTTGDGKFETPPDYPTSGAYPGKALVIDVDTSMQSERVHEIGFMDSSGRGWVREYFVPIYEPYIGDAGYKPAKICRTSGFGAGANSDLVLKAKNFIRARGYAKICSL